MKLRIAPNLAIVVFVAGQLVLLPMFATDTAVGTVNWDEAASVLEIVEKCGEENPNTRRDRFDNLDTISNAPLFGARGHIPVGALEVARHFCSRSSCPPKNKSPPKSA